MRMDIDRLLATVPALVLAGTLALADDWFGADEDLADQPDEGYSDPWATDNDADPWDLLDNDTAADDRAHRFRIYDQRGRHTGRAERNPFRDDSYALYDDRGRRTGRVDENVFRQQDYTVYDERGRRVREIRRNVFSDGEFDVYDDRGHRIGKIRKNSFLEDQYDVYDERGRRIGRVEGD